MKRLAVVVLMVAIAVLMVVLYAIGQTVKAPQAAKAKTTAEANIAQNHVGKYQIFISPFARPDIYLLDTETGQIWHPFVTKDTNLEVWIHQDRIDNKQQFDAWMALHNPPAAAPQQ